MKKLILLFAAACGLLSAQNVATDQCAGHNPIVITTTGTTVLIAAQTNRNIHVCLVAFALTAAQNVKFVSVGSGGKDLSGVFPTISTMTTNFEGMPVGLGLGFGINLGGATTGGGLISYYLSTGY